VCALRVARSLALSPNRSHVDALPELARTIRAVGTETFAKRRRRG
jgi:hypothetical protein